jgi:hypothetical protein
MSLARPNLGNDEENDERYRYQSEECITDAEYKRLFYANIVAAVFQALTGGAIFGLTDRDKKWTVYSTFPKSAQPDADGNPFIGINPKEQGSFPIGYLSGAFLLLSCLDHLIVCTVGRKAYEKGLSKNYNIFRWVEYMISASLMRALIGILSGVLDVQLIFQVFGQTLMTMIFGLIFELENSEKRLGPDVKWYLFWAGFIPHFFGWATVICYFSHSVANGDPPGFVYSIIFIIFFLDLTFPIFLGLQWRGKGRFRSYANGELAFIILSFTSKNLLAYINFFGGNR